MHNRQRRQRASWEDVKVAYFDGTKVRWPMSIIRGRMEVKPGTTVEVATCIDNCGAVTPGHPDATYVRATATMGDDGKATLDSGRVENDDIEFLGEFQGELRWL